MINIFFWNGGTICIIIYILATLSLMKKKISKTINLLIHLKHFSLYPTI